MEVIADCVADSSLARVQLFFPDPWHKKRHHKRRIVQPDFVQNAEEQVSHRRCVPHGDRLGKLR